MLVLVLDELDHACARSEALVRDVFSLAQTAGSRLVAIGIANRLDLTDRLLLDLRACRAAPQLLPFNSYTAKQLLAVLRVRCPSQPPLELGLPRSASWALSKWRER